jgi:hypothetical protein
MPCGWPSVDPPYGRSRDGHPQAGIAKTTQLFEKPWVFLKAGVFCFFFPGFLNSWVFSIVFFFTKVAFFEIVFGKN